MDYTEYRVKVICGTCHRAESIVPHKMKPVYTGVIYAGSEYACTCGAVTRIMPEYHAPKRPWHHEADYWALVIIVVGVSFGMMYLIWRVI